MKSLGLENSPQKKHPLGCLAANDPAGPNPAPRAGVGGTELLTRAGCHIFTPPTQFSIPPETEPRPQFTDTESNLYN